MYLNNNKLFFGTMNAVSVDKIPSGNWLLCFDPERGEFYLEKKDDFTLPDKLYGDVDRYSSKYLSTFRKNNKNMGVLLSGMKGTGKSLLAKKICIDSELPILIITQPYAGTGFYDFMSSLNQELVIFIDEYEKIYKEPEHQNGLLSIFDGSFSTRFFFLLTINEIGRMNDYMMNRPGRIRYIKEYKGLDSKTINDIIDDRLQNLAHKDEIKLICTYIGEISMDILTTLIEECNIYPNETPKELLKDLNLQPECKRFDVTFIRTESNKPFLNTNISYNPLSYGHINVSGSGYTKEFDGLKSYEAEKEVERLKADKKNKDVRYNWYYDTEWAISDCDVTISGDDIVVKLKDEAKLNYSGVNDFYLVFTKSTVYKYTL